VFYDYDCVEYGGEGYTDGDILLIGMHAPCPGVESFEGTVIYINGEPVVSAIPSRAYYLGPDGDLAGRQMSFSFSFVTLAAIQMPAAFSSFTSRPRNTGEAFLLYVSRRCLSHREDAFVLFSTISRATAGGKCTGELSKNGGNLNMNTINGSGSWTEAYELYSRYKFGLVMENTKKKGYITEKILNAFLGGTVPIYHGTEDVFDIFNKNAFVYFNESDPTVALRQVKYLLHDKEMYEKMLSEPILAPGAFDRHFAVHNRGKTAVAIRNFVNVRQASSAPNE